MRDIRVCVFDAYGTLFDVAAAARDLATEPGREGFAEVWPQVAADWRLKQLQYSWLRAITGDHCDFWQVTQDGLDWALARAGQQDADLREALLGLYWRLPAYPEVPGMLARLKGAGLSIAILSNGSPDMLSGAVESAGIGAFLDDVLSVEAVGVFKPARAVYDLVGARFSCIPGEVLFVSSNGWDAAAASSYGFRTLWVNRAGEPVDNLPGRPAHDAADLTGVPALLELSS
ncbi:MAG: haloacid dehalogenase, type II [Rhodobacteraceae bacterium HLUCCO18]|nr:MAG: haloacid dehalogenase, type II [Rhodobacteraceae bacterium HLUCCO18]